VTAFLPVSFPSTSPADSGSAGISEPEKPGGECILLVDDEAVLRQLARTILVRQGYTVIAAPGPAEALEVAAGQPDFFDLILADVMMPGMRGWEMVERLRLSQPRARVLYMSGYIGDIGIGGDKVRPLLTKPFKPRDLLDEVRRVLDAS
jgi:two-component system cell cycle sensor histidine kinase/response regulator CckA